ncbi:calphotin-like [Varroa destructor]|uniref:Uncharacterized protein n=1 Tax=Varroa destructor TaxID=109461 RepID=A0A7M7JB78_VARDE|nr:calphotin-like [Varroa destructor]
MGAFEIVIAALAVVAVDSQLITPSYGARGLSVGSGLYGISYASANPYGIRYVTPYATPAISYGTIASAPAVSYEIAAPAVSYAATPITTRAITLPAVPAVPYATAPAAARTVTYAAPTTARSISVAAAPAAIRTVPVAAPVAAAAPNVAVSAPAQPVNVGLIGTAGAPAVRLHEVHTGSGRQAIRIEDYQSGDQIIRVHEGEQAAPEIAQIAVPGEQHHVRIVEHKSGPAEVQRVLSRAPTQVVDVHKPGRPGARIIQVVKGQSPAPSIEFISAGGSSHHVYYADDVNAGAAAIGGGSLGGATTFATSYGPAVGGSVISAAPAISAISAAPAISTISAAPAISTIPVTPAISTISAVPAFSTISAAPAISTISAAPAISRISAAPSISVAVAPATAYSTRVAAGPAVPYSPYAPIEYGIYGLGGFNYGGLGHSTGYTSYGSGSNVFLDANKKSSAKKSA